MKSSLPVAVVLSGCGVYDGSEITEAVGLLIALSHAGKFGEVLLDERADACR